MPSAKTGPYRVLPQYHSKKSKWRVICVGAGASGLYLAYSMERRMQDYELQIYEKNDDVGGTWLENRYPGCACDVASHIYTYSFRPNPYYSSYYAGSEEIQKYFKAFEDEFGLDKYIQFNSAVKKAVWQEEKGIYEVTIQKPDGRIVRDWCHTLINCAGLLNEWKWPDISGRETFKGQMLHSAKWDPKVDYKDKTVGLIGVGSSGIQITPHVQKVAKHLTVFARSPLWITPQLGGFVESKPIPGVDPLVRDILIRGIQPFNYTEAEKAALAADPNLLLSLRRCMEIIMCSSIGTFRMGTEAQVGAFHYVTEHMKLKLGDNEEIKKKLIPTFPVGCRRPTPGAGYLEALVSENTDVNFTKIEEFNEKGMKTVDGKTHEFDVIICATGFTPAYRPFFDVIGKDGLVMHEEWEPEPNCYLGIAAPGFPNYFTVVGPRGPWGNGTILTALELNLDYFITFMKKMQAQGIKSVMPLQKATDDFAQHADAWHVGSIWSENCPAWYKKNGPDTKPYLWCGATPSYMKTMSEVRFEDYEYEYHNSNRFAYLGDGTVAADYMTPEEKIEHLVPYIRIAETPWEIA